MTERILNPQQEKFLAYYTNPNSETFSNALQSGLKAGYSQEYSESITAQLPDWLSESLGDMQRVKKAEKVLDRTLELPDTDLNGKIDSGIVRAKTDVAKFVAERLGKKKYSAKTDVEVSLKKLVSLDE